MSAGLAFLLAACSPLVVGASGKSAVFLSAMFFAGVFSCAAHERGRIVGLLVLMNQVTVGGSLPASWFMVNMVFSAHPISRARAV